MSKYKYVETSCSRLITFKMDASESLNFHGIEPQNDPNRFGKSRLRQKFCRFLRRGPRPSLFLAVLTPRGPAQQSRAVEMLTKTFSQSQT